MDTVTTAEDVLDFWFNQLTAKDWFKKSKTLDQIIRKNFLATHRAASLGELSAWRNSARGRLAEIIVLDQFSRNIFRDKPHAFEHDLAALFLAQEAVSQGLDENLEARERQFLYMPYMHIESAQVHHTMIELFTQLGLDSPLYYARLHKEIIERFGRYPHRNKILGRQSTPSERAFLTQPNSSF